MNTSISNPTNPSEKHFGFWGNLRLALKLMLAFSVVFIFVLVIVGVTLWGMNQVTTTYENTLAQGIEIRRLSDHLTTSLLKARDDEKNFILRWKEEGFDTAYANYATLHTQDVADMRKSIKQLALFGPVAATASTGDTTQAQYEADIASLTQNVDAYEQSFTALVEAHRKKGFDDSTDFESEFRIAASNIDAGLFYGQVGLEQLKITFLRLRFSEKSYLSNSEPAYAVEVHTFIALLKDQIAATNQLEPAAKTELLTQTNAYLTSFDALVELDEEIAIHNEELINAARTVESLAAKIESLGEQLAADGISTAQSSSARTFTVSIITVMIVLTLTIFISITLSQQITRPVTSLTNTAEQIASGNFDAQAEVSSSDEVGALAQTFNNMTARLRQAFEDVRRRALAVQTSAEVSQRLSVATNPRQLAVDVVEQVQSAFNYYHAHIYFFDDARENLVLAGGTGEAGETMLARGHKIPKGRGLVGRAADTNQPVLVPDVSQEDGWLPNPLLPDTKSEAAIPIASGNTVLGVLDVQQNVVNGLDEEDVSLLKSLASQVAISLQNARSFEQSKSQAELESLVNTIGQKIQRATTVDDTLQTAIREIGLALGAPRVSVQLGSPVEVKVDVNENA